MTRSGDLRAGISTDGLSNIGREIQPLAEPSVETNENPPSRVLESDDGAPSFGPDGPRPSGPGVFLEHRSAGGGLTLKPTRWYRSGLVSLGLVLAAIGGTAWLVRHFVPSVRKERNGAIEVMSRHYLSPQQGLILVRVGRRVLLVGVSRGGFETLCVIDDPIEVSRLLGQSNRCDSTVGAPFEQTLDDAEATLASGTGEGRTTNQRSPFGLERARSELQGLLSKLQSL